MSQHFGIARRQLDGEHERLEETYRWTKQCVIAAGFAQEVDWQARRAFSQLDETTFLQEAAWVILCSGFRESVVRRSFAPVSRAFRHWRTAVSITAHEEQCRANALLAYNHSGKIDAICAVARRVAHNGFTVVRQAIDAGGVEYLRTLPYIGQVTAYHLAKNIGLNVAKPDRHLQRIANAAGFACVQEFCATIAELSGDSVPVVDVVLWRFATLNPGYIQLFVTSGCAATGA